MSDKLAEMEYGEGAVRAFGKILMLERSPYEGEAKRLGVELGNLIAGVVMTRDGKGLLSRSRDKDVVNTNFDESLEMWEVELVIIPKRKFRRNTEEDFATLEVNQMLAGAWWTRESWKEQIFPPRETEGET